MYRFFVWIASLSIALPALAQETRQELLRAQREEKRAHIEPYKLNRVEEQMLRFDKAETPTVADWSWKGFYPRIAWPARGSGAALGLRYWQRDFWGRIDAAGAAFYSLKSYQHYDVQLGLIPHVGRRIPQKSWRGDDCPTSSRARSPAFSRIPFYLTLRYRYLPQEDFYGLGPDSELENRTVYLQEEGCLYFTTGYQFTSHFVWLLNGGYQRNEIRAGKSSTVPSTEEVFDHTTAPGLTNHPNYLRWGTQVAPRSPGRARKPSQGIHGRARVFAVR